MKEEELIKRASKQLTKNGGVAWFRRGRDVFGIFDIVYLDEAGRTHYFQISTIEHQWQREHKIRKFIDGCGIVPQHAYLMLWDYKANQFITKIIQ